MKETEANKELIDLGIELATLVLAIPHGIDPRIRELAGTLLRKRVVQTANLSKIMKRVYKQIKT